ncbi:hypothetical protein CMO83_02500 [Candidatus Woesearchaeota archaeon]|nr:hypothetical protein [Candidatus Woesearchaeota archaeon]MDP6648270.1 DUF4870 domain-containing protein [Candidatus Woesearchaeota archaeon]|tara:strand:- start:26499 stop:27053 length:555 start_codon:yes stop_codon:yes gene_type:complete
MAKQALTDYINKYKDRYPIDSLKQQLIKQGFPESEVEQAIQAVDSAPKFNPSPPQYSQTQSSGSLDPDTGKILAALSYPIWIIAIVTIVMAKNDRFARYHGFQALFWGIGFFILGFILNLIISFIFNASGIFGVFFGIFGGGIFTLIWLVWIVFSILFAMKAYKGQMFSIPLVTNIMKSIVKDL